MNTEYVFEYGDIKYDNVYMYNIVLWHVIYAIKILLNKYAQT